MIRATGGTRFSRALIQNIVQSMAPLAAQATANAIVGATVSAKETGIAAPVTLPLFLASMTGAVAASLAAIPKFADGGIVSGPTLGLMGEYGGARTNPEVIAPLDKLQGMMGSGSVNVVGKIRGRDILLSSERAGNVRSRTRY